MSRISGITNINGIIDATDDIADTMKSIGNDLRLIQQYTTDLQQLQEELNNTLERSKAALLSEVPSDPRCAQCVSMRQEIGNLSLGADFYQVENVTLDLASLQSFIDGDFQNRLDKGRSELQNFTVRLQDQVRGEIEEVNQRSGEILDLGRSMVRNVADAVLSIDFSQASEFLSNTVSPKMSTYGNYRYYVGIALGSVLILLAVLVYMGLCFGMCCETPGEEAGPCNRSVGATCLLAGVGVTFLFAWLLMVAVVVLFVTGGVSYSEICRPAVQQKNTGLIRVADNFLTTQLNNTKLQFHLLEVYARCENDTGIYSALNLESRFNLSGNFDTARNSIKSAIDGLIDNITPDLESVVIIDSSVYADLASAQQFAMMGINFTSFESALNQSIVARNLSNFVSDIKSGANSAPGLSEADRQRIINETDQMYLSMQTTIGSIITLAQNLTAVLSHLQDQIGPSGSQMLYSQIQRLTNALNDTQESIRLNSSTIILQFVSEFAQELFDHIFSFTNRLQTKLQTEIGRCRPVYLAVNSVINSTCKSFLDPYNGFWFSIGWCLFFCIPCLIISVQLATLYRRRDDYYSSSGKSFDDACYDAYEGIHHPDNFRLNDFQQPPSHQKPVTRESSYGHNNMVYEPDDKVLISNAQRYYPGARLSVDVVRSEAGLARPAAYNGPNSSDHPSNYYYP